MRVTPMLRNGLVALVSAVAVTAIGPAFAAPDQEAMQSQQAQSSNSGPYDDADFNAAKHAPN